MSTISEVASTADSKGPELSTGSPYAQALTKNQNTSPQRAQPERLQVQPTIIDLTFAFCFETSAEGNHSALDN